MQCKFNKTATMPCIAKQNANVIASNWLLHFYHKQRNGNIAMKDSIQENYFLECRWENCFRIVYHFELTAQIVNYCFFAYPMDKWEVCNRVEKLNPSSLQISYHFCVVRNSISITILLWSRVSFVQYAI